jgi:septal ring factor EnvC (AmiA/AmiB activator)
LENDNQQLKEQNDELNKRLQTVETENEVLSAQLRMFVTQLSQVQDQLRFNNITEFLLGGFRDSARVALRTPQSHCL